jgi:hypothetical protein
VRRSKIEREEVRSDGSHKLIIGSRIEVTDGSTAVSAEKEVSLNRDKPSISPMSTPARWAEETIRFLEPRRIQVNAKKEA